MSGRLTKHPKFVTLSVLFIELTKTICPTETFKEVNTVQLQNQCQYGNLEKRNEKKRYPTLIMRILS